MIDGGTRQILNTFIHFMKGGKSFVDSFEDSTKDTENWCPFAHGEFIDNDCYNGNPMVEILVAYLEKYIFCNHFLASNKYLVDHVSNLFNELKNPQIVKTYQRFDEALVTYSNYCFYSSIIIVVSAVEFRMHYMIKKTDEALYSEQFEMATLGQLIQIFDKNAYKEDKYGKIKKLMSERHRPLVQLLNEYRIVSAHPKEIKITPQIAESILNLSFAFLTYPETCLYDEDYLKCDT